MEIHLAIPVLRRYDLLRELLISLNESTVKPIVHVINNGRNPAKMAVAMEGFQVDVFTPVHPMGVAESWNWFIKNVPEERIISNDDIAFAPDSLEKMVAQEQDLVWGDQGFSCFLIRDECVRKLGLFDETLSPGYGYYEDADYLQRLDGCGTRERSASATSVDCGLMHVKSATLAVNTPAEWEEHHRRFWIAQQNYMKKWGLASL